MPLGSVTLTRAAVEIFGDLGALDKGLSAAERKLEASGKRLQSIGKGMSLRLTLPLVAAGAASVMMASRAEEAANKFDVVMGSAAESVRARLQVLTETIPMTGAAMEELAAGIQDMLVPMGVARSEAAGMSADMVELAGDLASFNDVDPSEVLEGMKSALAGASEPMRRYGVDTRVTRLEQIALEEGLLEVGEAMNETVRAQTVLIAIQQDSTDAMGDAGRTVDSTANSIKFLVRDLKQLGITMGQTVIPMVRPLIAGARDLLEVFQGLAPATREFAVRIAGLAAGVGPLLFVVGSMVTGFARMRTSLGMMATPLGHVSIALAAGAVAWQLIETAANAAERAIEDAVEAQMEAMTVGDDLTKKIIALNRSNHEAWQQFKDDANAFRALGFDSVTAYQLAWDQVPESIRNAAEEMAGLRTYTFPIDDVEAYRKAVEATTDSLEPMGAEVLDFIPPIKDMDAWIANLIALAEFRALDAEEWLPAYMEIVTDGLGETVDIAAEAGKEAGRALVAGIIRGTDSADLWNSLYRILETALIDKVSSLLGIASPSKIYEGYGRSLVEGLHVGITSNIDMLDGTFGGLARPALGGAGIRVPIGASGIASPTEVGGGTSRSVVIHLHQRIGIGALESERSAAHREIRLLEAEFGG